MSTGALNGSSAFAGRRAKLGLARALHGMGLSEAILALRRRSPVILRYHRVYADGVEPLYELGVSRALFEAQLDYLQRHCSVVPLGDVFDGLFHGGALPPRAVAITFDDGYRDNFDEAFPALRSRGLPATVFVSVENVERGMPFWWDRVAAAVDGAPRGPVEIDLGGGIEVVNLDGLRTRRRLVDRACEALKLMPHEEASAVLEALSGALGGTGPATGEILSWDQVAEMAGGGIEIGSHTLDHPVLSRLGADEAERQIVESRRRLEDRLGSPVRFFAYPNGKRDDVTPRVKEMVRRAGYHGAFSTIQGRPSAASDPFLVERIGVSVGMAADAAGDLSEALFATELAGIYDAIFMRRRRDRALS
ncbi:MAG TPA: polysaccharide deacetylase family protein [Vicinamibacteria bacterium]